MLTDQGSVCQLIRAGMLDDQGWNVNRSGLECLLIRNGMLTDQGWNIN